MILGWGKEETQFRGSAGKLSSSKPQESTVLTLSEDGQPRISWRGDGEYFAVSVQDPSSGEHPEAERLDCSLLT